jgi:hypothetical protein
MVEDEARRVADAPRTAVIGLPVAGQDEQVGVAGGVEHLVLSAPAPRGPGGVPAQA